LGGQIGGAGWVLWGIIKAHREKEKELVEEIKIGEGAKERAKKNFLPRGVR